MVRSGHNITKSSKGEIMGQQNWFDTLNGALESEGLTDTWDCCFSPISYGETRRYDFQSLDGKWHHVSITRETDGRYERPVHYVL